MWALSSSGSARSYSPCLLFVYACACHAGSVSLDTQGKDMEVTTTSLWTEAHMAQVNCKNQGSEPTACGNGRGSVLL